ncbi:MAG: PatB family C-S lyase [Desulfobacterales bacterium]|jgi:cystathionine beta-lyase|nr:PatB family C-S lyase [Desulfobacterales bacterium]
MFDFDEVIDRRGTASEKWEKYRGREVIPMWVADMDFRSPPAVVEALHRRVAHGVFGYTGPPPELVAATVGMLERDHGWRVDPDWIVWLPGLVCGLNVTCRAVGDDGDEVATLTPVYPPFLSAPQHAGRGVVRVPLREESNRWGIDFDRLEAALTPRTRMFMLCNPHNPVGRVFDRAELQQLAQLCLRRELVICADEIHCGLLLDPDKRHIPMAALGPEVAARTITLMSPSKTFNLAGLGCAFAVIPSAELRGRFRQAKAGIVPMLNPFGYLAAAVAYRECEGWRRALIDYLRGNRDLLAGALSRMPGGLAMAPVEGTYLAWIDVRPANLENPVGFFEEAGVGLQDGRDFDGKGFVRLNFGCPRGLLGDALARMHRALATRVA